MTAHVDLNAIAIHEAGHAVAAHLLGFGIHEVFLAEHWRLLVRGDRGGYVDTGEASIEKDMELDQLAVDLAGQMAQEYETRARVPTFDELPLPSGRTDFAGAEQRVGLLTSSEEERHALLEEAATWTGRFIRTTTFRKLVRSLAPELLARRGKMSGPEIVKILTEAKRGQLPDFPRPRIGERA